MRGQALSQTRKLNKHWQSAFPALPPILTVECFRPSGVILDSYRVSLSRYYEIQMDDISISRAQFEAIFPQSMVGQPAAIYQYFLYGGNRLGFYFPSLADGYNWAFNTNTNYNGGTPMCDIYIKYTNNGVQQSYYAGKIDFYYDSAGQGQLVFIDPRTSNFPDYFRGAYQQAWGEYRRGHVHWRSYDTINLASAYQLMNSVDQVDEIILKWHTENKSFLSIRTMGNTALNISQLNDAIWVDLNAYPYPLR